MYPDTLFHIFFQHKVSTAYHYLSLLFCDSINTFVAHSSKAAVKIRG